MTVSLCISNAEILKKRFLNNRGTIIIFCPKKSFNHCKGHKNEKYVKIEWIILILKLQISNLEAVANIPQTIVRLWKKVTVRANGFFGFRLCRKSKHNNVYDRCKRYKYFLSRQQATKNYSQVEHCVNDKDSVTTIKL